MLLKDYNENGSLFYTNFLETTSTGDKMSYRGDLVLIEGEVGDDLGHKKPPKLICREVVILAGDKIEMLLGGLDDINSLPILLEKYGSDFAPNMLSIFYVVNLKSAGVYEWNGLSIVLIPLVQGVPWNETMEELALEKGDFKGQKPADKLITMYKEMLGYKPKYPKITLEEAAANATNAKREIHGAV